MNRADLIVGVLAGLLCIAPVAPLTHTDADTAKAELLALHQADRRAHFHHDVNALLATVPAEFIYVRDGRVQAQNKKKICGSGSPHISKARNSPLGTIWNRRLFTPLGAVKMGWMVVRVKDRLFEDRRGGKENARAVRDCLDVQFTKSMRANGFTWPTRPLSSQKKEIQDDAADVEIGKMFWDSFNLNGLRDNLSRANKTSEHPPSKKEMSACKQMPCVYSVPGMDKVQARRDIVYKTVEGP